MDDAGGESGSAPLDIDHILLLLQVEQEQIQKRTFTNWVNAQLAKRRPPSRVSDLFHDFRDGSKLLDLLEVLSEQRIGRERGRGTFQHRSNIEKGLAFLRQKSIKLVNINIPDIMEGKPSIILGLVWTVILQYHIQELAGGLSFDSRQSSMESLASLDSRCSGTSTGSHRASPLHARFRLSAKKALMLWVREQCHKAGCSAGVRDFKASWRSGVLFLAILYALRRDLVDLSAAAGRSNKQNLEEAFRVAERELDIPRLLEPEDVDVREPDEKSIMTYVAQFLRYSKEAPLPDDDDVQFQSSPGEASPVHLPAHCTPAISASLLRQVTPERKVQEVSCWLLQAHEELLEGWDSTHGESYSERYNVFQTFAASFNEQRRPIVPLLTAARRSSAPSEEQRALVEAWDALTEKLREYKMELDASLPPPLDAVVRWLLKAEGVLVEEKGDRQDHGPAADRAKDKREQLKVCLEDMPQQMKTFQAFQNEDEYGNLLVPVEKMEDLKRRFTSVRVSAKYHGIKLEYHQHRHTVLDLLGRIRTKVHLWRKPYLSPEAVRVLVQDWREVVINQELPSMLEAAFQKLKEVSEKYSSKSALAADYRHVIQQVTQLEEDTVSILAEVTSAKGILARILTAWDSYNDGLSSMQAWLKQDSTSESVAEWGSRQAHLNEVANYLMESTDPETSRSLEEELLKLNVDWAEFVLRHASNRTAESNPDLPSGPGDLQGLIKEATLLLQEPVETTSGSLRTFRKQIQLQLRKLKRVDLEALDSSPISADRLQELKTATPKIEKTLCEAEQTCAELQHSILGLETRLAELLHWETEARETYRQLGASENQQQPGQDPRARVLISRGLQLEGQLVTEEQDLQLLITANKKNSPILYLQNTNIQDRVRAALAQSQETVGMLSSLGSRRDRSRSPTGGPPSKVFIQDKGTTPQRLAPPSSLLECRPSREAFVPKVVVQDYGDKITNLQDIPLGDAQARTGPRGQQDTSEDTLTLWLKTPGAQDTFLLRQVLDQDERQRKEDGKRLLAEMEVCRGERYEELNTQVQEKSQLPTLSPRKALSLKEVERKKAQGLKNRPWLRQTDQPEIQSPKKDLARDPHQATQPPIDKGMTGVTREGPRTRDEAQAESVEWAEHRNEQVWLIQKKQEQQRDKQQPIRVPHVEENKLQTLEWPLEQSQPPDQNPVQLQVRLPPPENCQMVAQGPTWAQLRPRSPTQNTVRPPLSDHVQLQSHPQSWAPVRASPPKAPAVAQCQASSKMPHGLQPITLEQTAFQTQSHVQSPPQPPSSPGLSHGYSKSKTQVAQPPARSQAGVVTFPELQPDAQARTHLEKQAQKIHHPQAQPHLESRTQFTEHTMSQHQIIAGSMTQAQKQNLVQAESQRYTQPAPIPTQPLTFGQHIGWSQGHPVTAYQTQSYSTLQYPDHAAPGQQPTRAQVNSSPSTWAQPRQSFSQPRPSFQPRAPMPEPQNQDILGLRHSVPQGLPQPLGQAPQYQAPQTPQWAQGIFSQRSANIRHQVQFPLPAYVQAPTWSQMRPWMPGDDGTLMQMQQGHTEPQMWMRGPHPSPTRLDLQAHQYPAVEHHLQSQQQAQMPPQLNQSNIAQLQLQPGLWAPSQRPVQTHVNVLPNSQAQQSPMKFPTPAQRPNQPLQSPWTHQPISPELSQTQLLPEYQAESQEVQIQPGTRSLGQYKPELQGFYGSKFQSSNQTRTLAIAQDMPQPEMHFKPQKKTEAQYKEPMPTQDSSVSKPKTMAEPQSPRGVKLLTSSPSKLPAPVQTAPELEPQSPTRVAHQAELLSQAQTESDPKSHQNQTQAVLKSSVRLPPQSPTESPAPPHAYSEAYATAQALARNGFEDAKHCLQEHILEAISDKCLSAEQASVENKTRILDPELLEEFLRAAKGMEAFCTPSQLTDMVSFTQSVRSQWEACFSFEGKLAQADQRTEALRELCRMLIPEDAHRLARTELRECQSSLAAIQRQLSSDQEAALADSRVSAALDAKPVEIAQSVEPQIPLEVPQDETAKALQEDVKDQSFVKVNKKEDFEKYEHSKRSLEVQLSKNEQSINEVPSDSVTLKGLHTRLQEIQFLRQDTESLWSEFVNHCSQLSGDAGLDEEKSDLQDQWQAQQSQLQRRGSSLGAALRQIDSTENHMVDFVDRLDRYLRQPKDITAFTLANTHILKDIKELDENIQCELDQLDRLDPESSNLDPRDGPPLTQEVLTHRNSLDQLRQQVRKSEAAARALDRFLMSLRTVEEDIGGVLNAPSGEAAVLQDCHAKLALVRQSVDSLKNKAPQLDLLLQGARLTVTRDGSPASCLDMVKVLLAKVEEVDGGLSGQRQSLKRETRSQSMGLRKRTLVGEFKKLHESIESQSLTEATVPALQRRLRALSDLEDRLQARHSEIQSLRELPESQMEEGRHVLDELEAEYNQTLAPLTDGKQRCVILIELLKKFQSCRAHLSSTVQRAEQAIGERASYMGRENLHRTVAKVQDIKQELSGLGEQMDEMRTICRQLQSHLNQFPDCREAPFQSEADALMDSWLDMTEKTDTHLDNLQVGSELWDKQLMLGAEIDGWSASKLAAFAESHPFHNRRQVLAMKEEMKAHGENLELFHKRSEEIQEMLQSQEAPLELQVMETQLKKRMDQVRELFADCEDVFEELMVVKKHLAEKIEECLSAVERIQSRVNEVQASEPESETQLKDLYDDLEVQEEQVELVVREMALVSSVASPQVLEELSVDCQRLTDAVTHTKETIQLRRKEKDKGLLKVIGDQRQSFEDWFQDLQLAVNECFENPESRTDIEVSLQRLNGFLKANDAERRLEQLKVYLERGHPQMDARQLSELSDWLKEQHQEVQTFKTHCQKRHEQMESLYNDLNSLQMQCDSFQEWLQGKEKLSATSDTAKHLLQDLRSESPRADVLLELLASVRRQGVRADTILKDSDDLIQRYRDLEARLQGMAEEHRVLEEQVEQFRSQAEHMTHWFKELHCPLTPVCGDPSYKEMGLKAEVVLRQKTEGDSKMEELYLQSRNLCERQDLEQSRKELVLQLLQDLDDEWTNVLLAAEETLNRRGNPDLDQDRDAVAGAEECRSNVAEEAETPTSAAVALRSRIESTQSWIQEERRQLLSLGSHLTVKERLETTQAFLSSQDEGASKVVALKREAQDLWEKVHQSQKPELSRLLEDTEQQWDSILHATREAQLRLLDTDFEVQSQEVRSWLGERERQLSSVGVQSPPEDRRHLAQDVLQSKPDGDRQVNNLRRRGQTLFDRRDVEEDRKCQVQQEVRDLEEQWRNLLQHARQLEQDAESQIKQEMEMRDLQWRDFQSLQQDISQWLSDLQHQLDSLSSQATVQDRIHVTQSTVDAKSDGDRKIQELKRRSQSLWAQELEEAKKAELQVAVRDTEEAWTRTLRGAKAALRVAEDQTALEHQLKEHEESKEEVRAWLEDKRRNLDSLRCCDDPEAMVTALEDILSSKPQGDFKLAELHKQSQKLCDSRETGEEDGRESTREIEALDQLWRSLLLDAEDCLNKGRVLCSISRERRAFFVQAAGTQTWQEELQTQLQGIETDSPGGPDRIEDRLNVAQLILSSKSGGESRVTDLESRAQNLCGQKDLGEESRLELQITVKKLEEQWRSILRSAEKTSRRLQSVKDLQVACQCQRGQAVTRLAELRTQTADLPRVFPWPGLGERRQAAELTRTLLDRASAMGPILSDLHEQAAELFRTTQDPDWSDPTYADMEESIPVVVEELTETLARLDQGIVAERRCTQLLEQHEAAQHWLKDQVKGLPDPPDDRAGLHSVVNTLKALLQTIHRETKEMKELDTAKDDLLGFCTPGGRDALTLEVSHLQQLCSSSQMDVTERLLASETRLQELDSGAARRSLALEERVPALRRELSSLDLALEYAPSQNTVDQLQRQWSNLQVDPRTSVFSTWAILFHHSFTDLGKVASGDSRQNRWVRPGSHHGRRAIAEIERHDGFSTAPILQSRLGEHRQDCAANTVRCLDVFLRALQVWNGRKPSQCVKSLQEATDEGEKLQTDLREAFSHHQYLKDCLDHNVFEPLAKEALDSLKEAEALQLSLSQTLKELSKKNDPKTEGPPTNDFEEMKVSLVASPRKNKQSPEKKSQLHVQQYIPPTVTFPTNQDDLMMTSGRSEKTETNVSEDIQVPPRNRMLTEESSLQKSTVWVETKQTEFEVSDKGQEDVLEQSQLLPPGRVSRTEKTKKDQVVDDVERNVTPQVSQFVVGIIESAMSDVENQPNEEALELESRETLSPLQVVTEIPPGDVVEESKILHSARKSKSVNFPPQLPENEEQIMRKNNSNLDTLGDVTHDDHKEIFCEEAQKASGSLEASVAEIVTGIIDSALRDVNLLSKKELLDCENTKMSSVITEASEIGSREDENVSHATERSKTVEFSPQPPENKEPVTPKQEYVEVRTDANQEPGVFQEERKEPESEEATVIADFVTGLIESAVRDAYLPTRKDHSESDHDKTPRAVIANPEVVTVEEEKLIAPTRKSKSLKLTPQEKATVTKDECDLEPEEKNKELCQGCFSPEVKKDSENGDASFNPVTEITEPAVTDVDLLPNKEEASSAVVTTSQDVDGDKGQVSTPRRKSKRGKVTATEQQSDSSNRTEQPTTPQPPQRKSRRSTASSGLPQSGAKTSKDRAEDTTAVEEEAASAKSGMTLTETPKLPYRKKSKNEDVSSGPSIAVNVVLGPESGLQATPEQSGLEGSKLSPPKRRPKSLKASPEPQKVQDQTLTKEEPHTMATQTTELTVCRVVEENTSETESYHVTLRGDRPADLTEMMSIQQTTTPTETLIELELLETERLEEAEDHKEPAIGVEDANAELEKSLFFIDTIPGGAVVDTLQLNICNQVEDENDSAVSRESKGDSSVLLTTLQPNATEMIEIVLCEKSTEKTVAGSEPLQTDQEAVTRPEERGAPVFTGASQDTATTIHVRPDVSPVEMREHQEEQKDKPVAGNEDREKPTNHVSLVEKNGHSGETQHRD
ncbi:uncharacterized protein syne2b [Stigmatopora argus]